VGKVTAFMVDWAQGRKTWSVKPCHHARQPATGTPDRNYSVTSNNALTLAE
jgi:hypothetical protein